MQCLSSWLIIVPRYTASSAITERVENIYVFADKSCLRFN